MRLETGVELLRRRICDVVNLGSLVMRTDETLERSAVCYETCRGKQLDLKGSAVEVFEGQTVIGGFGVQGWIHYVH